MFPPAVLRPIVWRDLFGLTEVQARQALLAALTAAGRPAARPAFPPRQRAGETTAINRTSTAAKYSNARSCTPPNKAASAHLASHHTPPPTPDAALNLAVDQDDV